jgi:D-glycero-beta-D-manno-heptose-7-phosphate kinase
LLNEIKSLCRARGIWLSLDPKPVHHLNLKGFRSSRPIARRPSNWRICRTKRAMRIRSRTKISCSWPNGCSTNCVPAVLLITLGELGMLLCQRGQKPFHIPTVAQEVFDVSGAGDTVIATFTLAIAAGASPLEAAILSNHAAGIVVGKVGTATTTPEELLESFRR